LKEADLKCAEGVRILLCFFPPETRRRSGALGSLEQLISQDGEKMIGRSRAAREDGDSKVKGMACRRNSLRRLWGVWIDVISVEMRTCRLMRDGDKLGLARRRDQERRRQLHQETRQARFGGAGSRRCLICLIGLNRSTLRQGRLLG
jgi:hypothetical protein